MLGGPGVFWLLFKALLIVGTLWWSKEVLGRLGRDIGRLRSEADATEKGVIVLIWLITLGLWAYLFFFIAKLVSRILYYF